MTFDSYKGVRDFYPEDERIQKHIFGAMRRAVESYGYEEMNASILEPTDLYTAKTSEEIISQQTYTFTDRGERSVTLRPEMTPSVARMVAARKRELPFPLRWYSIQNFFRYERPQRGRLREFWQLNADLFGVVGIEADIEVIGLADRVLGELGASSADYAIKVSSRAWLTQIAEKNSLSLEQTAVLKNLLDRKSKMSQTEFNEELARFGNVTADVLTPTPSPDIEATLRRLSQAGIDASFDPSIVRGFDYYTGIVFEVFDTNPVNSRSMFGGGRYDNLVGQYGKEDVPAVGFAMGDVIARDFLETHGLLPVLPSLTKLYIAPVLQSDAESAADTAESLRKMGLSVALGMGHEKLGDHIKAAAKLKIPYFTAYGEKENESGTLTIKNLNSGEEKTLALSEAARYCIEK